MQLPYDETEVRAAFDGATFQRGRHYAVDGSVRGLEVSDDGRQLWAQVRGSGRRPYRVQVTVAEGRVEVKMAGSRFVAEPGDEVFIPKGYSLSGSSLWPPHAIRSP